MVKVQICGVTSVEDAKKAVYYGADAIGVVVEDPSLRCVDLVTAKIIFESLPPLIYGVLLTRSTDIPIIQRAINTCKPHAIQIGCGIDISKLQFKGKIIRVIPIPHDADLLHINQAIELIEQNSGDAYCLDTHVEGKLGGLGIMHDLEISAVLARKCHKPIILAGGLNPDNVTQAILKVRPFAVDVSSGVEVVKGKKDPLKLKKFIENAQIEPEKN